MATPEDVAFAGLTEQAELVRRGEVSSRELTELSIERIVRLDRQLNAFRVVLAERALEEADRADQRRAAGEQAPLLGVPVAAKDNVDVAGRGHYSRHECIWGSRDRGRGDRQAAARARAP